MLRNVHDGESWVVFVGNIGRSSFEGRINFGKKGVPEGILNIIFETRIFPKRFQTRVRCTMYNVTQYSLHFTVQIMDAVINCSVQRMKDFCNIAKTHC